MKTLVQTTVYAMTTLCILAGCAQNTSETPQTSEAETAPATASCDSLQQELTSVTETPRQWLSEKGLAYRLWMDLGESHCSDNSPYLSDDMSVNRWIAELFCLFATIAPPSLLEKESGLPPLTKGSLKLGANSWSESTFCYYNPDFVRWVHENLLPPEDDRLFTEMTRSTFRYLIGDFCKLYYVYYSVLENHPDERETALRAFNDALAANEYFSSDYFTGDAIQAVVSRTIDEINKSDHSFINKQYGRYFDAALMKFWFRRSIDGSRMELGNCLAKLLNRYEPGLTDLIVQMTM